MNERSLSRRTGLRYPGPTSGMKHAILARPDGMRKWRRLRKHYRKVRASGESV